ncbi:class I glutamine amidotransferase-like protein [Earliella scabrosa]|nr:class I glutamine amidotransferase-like protein [Earliella scabrosa]
MSEQTKAPNATTDVPRKLGVLVFPTFQPLDVFGSIDALQILSWGHKLDLYMIGPTLDPVSTATLDPAWNTSGSQFGVTIQPTHTYDNIPDDLDVLLVPGGAGAFRSTANIEPMVEVIKKVYPRLKYLIGVCNGSGLLAEAGVLDGKRATTTKPFWKKTTAMGPNVNWVHRARFVVDGNIWTSSGVSSGIDLTVAWIAHVYGQEEAQRIANQMEYMWNSDPNQDPFVDIFGEGM